MPRAKSPPPTSPESDPSGTEPTPLQAGPAGEGESPPPAPTTRTERAAGEMGSLFGPEADNRVGGELLLKLQAGVVAEVSESIPSGPPGVRSDILPTLFGLPAVDAVLREHPIRSITRLHGPMPTEALARGEDRSLGATFRVRLAAGSDLERVCAELAQTAEVEELEPNRWREASVLPDDPGFASQWGLVRIHCPEAWEVSRGQPGVVVAVVDSGIDLDHPELAPLLLPGLDVVDLADTAPPAGTRFEGDWLQRDDRPQDEVGHGTHVAGTIACVSNNGSGVTGINWLCSLLPVKVLTRIVHNDASGRVRAIGSAADIAAGIRWAVDHGAQIINLSLGGYSSTFVERDAVAYAVASGVVVVAAMGNDGSGTPAHPAACPGVIAVGATDPLDKRAPFSNFGSHLSLVAPGTDILSTAWKATHGLQSGTSMACPHVSGVAALVKAWNPSLNAEQIATILRETAEPLREQATDPIPNDFHGFGLVNALAALQRASPKEVPRPDPFRPPFPGNTLPTVTRPPFTRPTRTRPPTMPTLPTLTRPTLTLTRPTNPTFPTQTRPTLTLTRPTNPTVPTQTRPTFPRPPLDIRAANNLRPPLFTRPPFPTIPTLPTNPTFPTNPTVVRPTFTRPTCTRIPCTRIPCTRPTYDTRTIGPRPINTIYTGPGGPAGLAGSGPAGAMAAAGYEGYEGYGDPYGASADPYGYGASGYEAYDPYAGYGYGYESQAYDPYGYGASYADAAGGYGYDPYGTYADYYGAGSDPYTADPYAADPYAGASGYEGYTGYEGYAYDPYQGYPYNPYQGYAYDPYQGYAYDPYQSYA